MTSVAGEVVDSVAELYAVEGVFADECRCYEFADDLAYDVGDECALGFAPAYETIVCCYANEKAFGEEVVGGSVSGVADVVAEGSGVHVGSMAAHVCLAWYADGKGVYFCDFQCDDSCVLERSNSAIVTYGSRCRDRETEIGTNADFSILLDSDEEYSFVKAAPFISFLLAYRFQFGRIDSKI